MRSLAATGYLDQVSRTLPRPVAVGVASMALLLSLAAAGAPAPLYVVYQERFGISAAGLTGAFAVYILAAATALLTCGRLSDHLGRRPVGMVALLCSAAGCVALASVHDLGMLLLGRGLQGVGSGLATSVFAAYVIDLAGLRRPGRPSRLAPAVASGGATGGLALGAVASGFLVQFAPQPLSLGYLVLAAALMSCAFGVLFCPETSRRDPGALRSLRPTIHVPAAVRDKFLPACCCFVAAFALGGFYQALGPSLAASELGHSSHFFGGLVVASLVGVSALGGPATSPLRPHTAMLVGAAGLIVTVPGILVALAAGSVPGFIVASVAAGLAFGSAFSGGIRTLLSGTTAAERAGLLAAVYLISYLGSAAPAFAAGLLVPLWGLALVTRVYCGLVVLLAATALIVTVSAHVGLTGHRVGGDPRFRTEPRPPLGDTGAPVPTAAGPEPD